MSGHSDTMPALATLDLDVRPHAHDGEGASDRAAARAAFNEVYDAHFDFVWRSARRLGAPESATDDVVQEVFLVVHRRLAEFEGRSSVRTWLFGIVLRVVADYRRSARRKGAAPLPDVLPADERTACPGEQAAQREQVELLHRLLDTLDDDRRAVFILAELEQMTAPEIAEALSVNVNTVYTRLRAARQRFNEALTRARAGAR